MEDQVHHGGAVHLAGMGRHAPGEIFSADETNTVHLPFHAGLHPFHVTARFGGQVHHDTAGPHGGHHVASNNDRRLPAEHLCRGDDDIRLGNDLGHGRLLPLLLFFGQFGGVTVPGLPRFAQVNLNKLRAQ